MKSDYLLIIASSGRMLVQAAHRANLNALVIDLFTDCDTQAYAADFQKITALTIECLIPALDYFNQHYTVTQIVYGSGFEQHPESLCYLANRYTLLGNSPETFMQLQNKAYFFAMLNQLNIPIPETTFIPPTESIGWLIKPTHGQGGVGIQRYNSKHPAAETLVYWQRYQAGSQHSVLFLADGQKLQVIGFNSQWTIRLSDGEEFIFAGIINDCPLSATHKAQITDWLTKLVPLFTLTGLNSLDFIHADSKNHVLEINPRPPASMQLYDADLLRRHIMTASPVEDWQSCLQSLQSGYTGYQIIYAEQNVQISADYVWENGVMDIPAAGAICNTGQPICSIIAHHSQANAVLQELTLKQHTIKQGLYTHGTHTQR